MKEHPGSSYQEALRAVTAVGASNSMLADPNIDLMTALGIDEIDEHNFEEVWSRHERAESIRVPYAQLAAHPPAVGRVYPISGVSGVSLASVEVGHSVGECYCERVQRGLPAHRPALLAGAFGV